MEDVEIYESWAIRRFSDSPVMSWDELWEGIDEATLPGDRILHVELDQYDWGASGPWEVIVEVAISWGFDTAVGVLSGWLLSRLGSVRGVLTDVEEATRVAVRHLKKYHRVTDPILDETVKAGGAWTLLLRDGHRRYRVEVRGKHSLIVKVEPIGGKEVDGLIHGGV